MVVRMSLMTLSSSATMSRRRSAVASGTTGSKELRRMPTPKTRWITRSCRSRAMRSCSLDISRASCCSSASRTLMRLSARARSSGWKKGFSR